MGISSGATFVAYGQAILLQEYSLGCFRDIFRSRNTALRVAVLSSDGENDTNGLRGSGSNKPSSRTGGNQYDL